MFIKVFTGLKFQLSNVSANAKSFVYKMTLLISQKYPLLTSQYNIPGAYLESC